MRSSTRCAGAVVALLATYAAVSAGTATAAPTTTVGAPTSTRPGTTLPPSTTTRPGTTLPVPSSTTTTAAPPASTTTTTTHSTPRTTTTVPVTTPPVAARPSGVSLVSQAPWIPTHGSEVIGLHLDDAALASIPGADVQVTVHRSVSSRSDFENAINGTALGSTRNIITFPLSSIQLNRRHEFLIGFGLSGSDAPRRIGLEGPGVYPVEIGVTDSGTDRATFVTWMVVIDPDAARSSQPLRVSWIWRLETPPLELPGGAVDPAALPPLRPGGRLDHIATLLARAGPFPLTLGIGPEMMTRWAADSRTHPAEAASVKNVRTAAQRPTTQLLPEPYVPIDGPVIEAEGLGDHVTQEYVAGSSAIEQMTGEIPDPRTAFVESVDEPTVSRLTQLLVGRFVVPDSALVPVAEDLTPAQPFTLTTRSGVRVPAVATDSRIEKLIESPGPPALRVQRVLASLAEIAYEAPSEPRGIVLSTPSDWSPDIATVSQLLRALSGDPLVEPATLDGFFSGVAPAARDGVAVERQLAPTGAPSGLPLRARDYADAVRDLTAYQSMVGRTDPSIEIGKHSLLLALSTANTPSQALAHLRTITANLETLTNGITTTAKTLTLTARRANLPLSFQNNTGRAGIRVKVHLESTKLIFPKGSDFTLALPLGHTTARRNQFPVEARASGSFAMTITLESPDGTVQIGSPTRVTIRSAVFSGIGIALTLGALLFLAGWWGNHFWRTRRARRTARAS